MKTFTYENQGINTFLVYTVKAEDQLDSMSLGMLANNRIPGLAQTLFTQMDTTKYIKYNVSSKVSASQLFSGSINQKRLLGVFSGIADAMLSAEEYMIDPSMILLDLNYIFVDVSSCDTILICLPIVNGTANTEDLGSFFKRIMFSTKFDQTENCDYVAKIINYLNSAPMFSIADFKGVLESIKHGGNGQQAYSQAPQPMQSQAAPQPVMNAPQLQRSNVQPPQQAFAEPKPQSRPPLPQMQIPQKAPQMQAAAAPVQQPVQPIPPIGTAAAAQPQTKVPEEKISLFYLMQHYNKENAAAYKAQKEAKKNAAAVPNMQGAPAAALEKGKKEKKEKSKKGAQQPNFAEPGQQSGFAVPFQTNPVSAPAAGKKSQNPQGMPNERSGVQPSPTPQPAAQVAQQQPSYSAQPSPMQQPVYQSPVVPAYQAPAMPQNAQPQTTPMNFGETTVLGGGTTIGETTVLGDGEQNVQLRPHLIRSKNNERIDISKPVFRIGKERSYVDYFIGDNTAVSRSHANIVSRDGDFFIVDTNSTNHTYVNGGIILSNSETRLSHGAKIRLANEEFEFRLY